MVNDVPTMQKMAAVFASLSIMSSVVVLALLCTPAWSAETDRKSLKCNIGPTIRTYGKSQWLVYSCDDQRTVVFVTAPGNPAMPFYFLLSPNNDGYKIEGEGTGRKEATAAAFEELRLLSQKDIVELIERTRKR